MRRAPILTLTASTLLLVILCVVGCKNRHSGSDASAPATPQAPIDQGAPSLVLFHPIPNAIGVGTNTSLFLQFDEAMDLTSLNGNSIQLLGSAGPIAGNVETVSQNALLFFPSANLEANQLHTVTITSAARDAAGNFFSGPFSWSFTTGGSVDALAPAVEITLPANGASDVPYNLASLTVVFSEAMNPLTIDTSSLRLEQAGTPVAGTVGILGTSVASFAPAAALTALTTYTGKVETLAKDLAGNTLASTFSWTFTTGVGPDSVPPSVVITNPEAGMGGIPVNTAAISVAFSEPMDASSINASTFSVELAGVPIAGNVIFSGTTAAVFHPAGPLAALSLYTARIGTGAKDLAGTPLTSPFVWTFTTGSGPDIAPPSVVFTTPNHLANGIPAQTAVTAVFNEAIDPVSVNGASFKLEKNAITVPSSVSVVGASLVQLIPNAPFPLLASYNATLTNAIKDMSGNSLPQTSWSFTAKDGVWQTAGSLGANPATAKFDLGMDGAGNAWAIWQRDDGPSIDDHIFVRRFDASSASWSPALQLDSAPTSAANPRLAVNLSGNAFAIWEQNDATPNSRVVVRRFDAGTASWGSATVLFTNSLSTRACVPQIAIDNAGNALAAWLGVNTGSQLSLYVARFDATSASWGTGSLLESSSDPVTMFRIVANGAGDAAIVFGQGPGSTAKDLYARRYLSPLATWSAPNLLDLGSGALSSPTLAIDPAGNLIAVWIQKNTNFASYANRFDAGLASWQGETLLDTGNVAAFPAVAMDSAGNAIAAWESGTPITLIHARRYDKNSASWGAIVPISDNSNNSSTPSLALDPDGNGLVLWSQRDGVQNNILASRFVALGVSFGLPTFVETAPRTATNPLVLLGGPQHKGIAIWKQLNASNSDLWTNRFE